MDVVVIGAGRIGSAFAFHLARAGHTVTVVARGARLEALRREGAIVSVTGERAEVRVAAALDGTIAHDLVLVTVLRHQLDVLMPTLAASAAKTVTMLFNTFDAIDPWRDAIGAHRFVFGFPNMVAFLVDGRLRSVVDGPGMVTTLNSAAVAEILRAGGLPTEVEPDMTAYLRSHAAFVVPTMVAAQWMWGRTHALRWSEATRLAAAMHEAFAVVRGLGHPLRPRFVGVLAGLPGFVVAAMLWMLARTRAVKDLGEFGPDEVRALIDAMHRAAPNGTPILRSVRP